MANQTKPSPPAPTVLSMKVGKIKETKNGFVVPLIAKLYKGITVLKNVEIIFKQGTTEIGKEDTDQTGEAVFNHVVSLDQEDTVINFRAIADLNESLANAVIPKKAEKTAKKKKGPKIMEMSRYAVHGQPGVYILWANVQGLNGSAYKGRVVFTVRGVQYEVIADRNGYAALTENPITVLEDEVLNITASIHEENDGIVDSAQIILRRPGFWPTRWTREWLESPRGYAGVARWVVMILLIIFTITILTSEYDSILLPIKKEISKEELLLQKIRPHEKVILPESKGEFPGGFMMFLFFLTVGVYGFSLIVNMGMLRDTVITAYDNVTNKYRGHVADPFSERVSEWFKLLSVAKEHKNEDKDSKEKEPEIRAKKAGLSIAKIFASDMASQIIGDIIIRMVPAIFLKRKLN